MNVTVVVDAPTICTFTFRTPRLTSVQRADGSHAIADTATPIVGPVSVTLYNPSSSVTSRHSPAGTVALPLAGSPGPPIRLMPPAFIVNVRPASMPVPATLQNRSVPNVARFVIVTVVVDAPTTCALSTPSPTLTSVQRPAGTHVMADTATPAGTLGSPASYVPSRSVASRHSPAGTLRLAEVGSPVLGMRLIPPADIPNTRPVAIPVPATLQNLSTPSVERFVNVTVVIPRGTATVTTPTPRLASVQLAAGSQVMDDTAMPASAPALSHHVAAFGQHGVATLTSWYIEERGVVDVDPAGAYAEHAAGWRFPVRPPCRPAAPASSGS